MPVTLHPFWLGTGGVPSLRDPQWLGLALMVACVAVFLVMLPMLARALVQTRKLSKARTYHATIEKKLKAYQVKEQAHEKDDGPLKPLGYDRSEVFRAEGVVGDIARKRRKELLVVVICAVLLVVMVELLSVAYAFWWIEGGYDCASTSVRVTNRLTGLDHPGANQTWTNLCEQGVFAGHIINGDQR